MVDTAIVRVLGVKVYYGGYRALNRVSLNVEPGEVVGVVGPNGSGKTTLLKTIDGILKPRIGSVYIDGREVAHMKRKEVARLIGYVPQRLELSTNMSVADFVLTGRRPYIGFNYTRRDLEIALNALEMVDALHLASRRLDQLSGGELQRVVIARALAADPRILLLDEPTASLDPRYQVEVLRLILRLAREKGLAVVMSLHNLTQAYRFSDKVVMLRDGEIYAAGRPEEVLTPKNIKAVFGVEALVLRELRAIEFK